MSIAAIPVQQHIEHAGLDHNACRAVSCQLPQFVPEPLAAVNHRGHEIIEALPFDRHGPFQPCDGVIPGRQRTAHRGR